jgi:hypothetical protein
MFLKRILHYLDPRTLFGKSNPDSSLRFLFCVVVMILRACTR